MFINGFRVLSYHDVTMTFHISTFPIFPSAGHIYIHSFWHFQTFTQSDQKVRQNPIQAFPSSGSRPHAKISSFFCPSLPCKWNEYVYYFPFCLILLQNITWMTEHFLAIVKMCNNKAAFPLQHFYLKAFILYTENIFKD